MPIAKAPVSWEEIEQFSIENKDRLELSLIGSNVSVDLFIAFVNFHIRTDRILSEFSDQIIPRQFMALVGIVMAGVRSERAEREEKLKMKTINSEKQMEEECNF